MAVYIDPPKDDNTEEWAAGNALKDLLERDWGITPDTPDEDGWAFIIVHAKPTTREQIREDLDLLVLIRCGPELASNIAQRRGTETVECLILIIEVKDHTRGSIDYRQSGEAKVLYKGKWSSATGQSKGQLDAMASFLATKFGGKHNVPFLSRIVWFHNESISDYPFRDDPNVHHRLIFRDTTMDSIVEKAIMGNREKKDNPAHFRAWGQNIQPTTLGQIRGFFLTPYRPTSLDRRKIDAIAASVLVGDPVNGIPDGKGQSGTLIYSGFGGTGKTFALIANSISRYQAGDRVLILTFNTMLTYEIRRLLGLYGGYGIPSSNAGGPCISVATLSSWVKEIGVALGIVDRGTDIFPEQDPDFYPNLCRRILGELKVRKAKDTLGEVGDPIAFDATFIDEAQDVPPHEKDLIQTIFTPGALSVGNGYDQAFRSTAPTNWSLGPSGARYSWESIPRELTTCYRMKSNLCRFANRLATAIGLANHPLRPWQVQENTQASGGKVIVQFGDAKMAIHDQFCLAAQANAEVGNQPIDMLVCMDTQFLNKKRNPRNDVADWLAQRNHLVWDGTVEEKDLASMDPDHVRLVLLDHCRGLEGWVVALMGLDRFLKRHTEATLKGIDPVAARSNGLDPEKVAHEAALKVIMIAMTRAMDTLIIHVSDEQSFLGQALKGLKCDYVEIHKYS
jgi:hypothetical protein